MGNGFKIFNVIDRLFELSNKTNAAIYVLNYRGYGKSTGDSRFINQFKDNQNFFDSLKHKSIKVDFVIGHSLGTVFFTYLTTDNQIPNLYLLAPFSSAQDMINHAKSTAFSGFKKLLQPFFKLEVHDKFLASISSVQKIKYYNGHLVVFHGTKDDNLPYEMGVSVYNNCPSKNKELIPILDGDHESPYEEKNWALLIQKINK